MYRYLFHAAVRVEGGPQYKVSAIADATCVVEPCSIVVVGDVKGLRHSGEDRLKRTALSTLADLKRGEIVVRADYWLNLGISPILDYGTCDLLSGENRLSKGD